MEYMSGPLVRFISSSESLTFPPFPLNKIEDLQKHALRFLQNEFLSNIVKKIWKTNTDV